MPKPDSPRVIARKQKAFLEEYAKTGNVTKTVKKLKIGLKTVYSWAKKNKKFKESWQEIKDELVEALEQEASRRAHGWKEPQFTKDGALAGYVAKHSDTLLIFLLKANRPDKYAGLDKISVEGGDKPIAHVVKIVKFSDRSGTPAKKGD